MAGGPQIVAGGPQIVAGGPQIVAGGPQIVAGGPQILNVSVDIDGEVGSVVMLAMGLANGRPSCLLCTYVRIGRGRDSQ